MRANLSFATVPNLPDEARAQLAADIASLRSEVERIFGKGTHEALAIIASIDDDTQEALARGLANLPTFQCNGGNLQAWIATIAHNLRIDRARAATRESAVFSRAENDLDAFPSTQRSPETLAMLREACKRVSDAMDRMAPASKQAFLLFYFDGLSHAQIGAALGMTEAAAKMRCVRVHEKLVEELGEHVSDILNDLRCRLPPLFWENARAERLRVERLRRAYEATHRAATLFAMLFASMLAVFRVGMPFLQSGLHTPRLPNLFVQTTTPMHELRSAPSAPVSAALPARGPVAKPTRPALATNAEPSQADDEKDDFNRPRDEEDYGMRTF